MRPLKIEGTEDTPSIILDKTNNVIEFSGMSLPENVTTFYEPVFKWIDEYVESPNPQTEVIMKFDYFNTSSSKVILDILMKFKEIIDNGNEVIIKWYYKEYDEDMKEAGEEYTEIVEMPSEIIEY